MVEPAKEAAELHGILEIKLTALFHLDWIFHGLHKLRRVNGSDDLTFFTQNIRYAGARSTFLEHDGTVKFRLPKEVNDTVIRMQRDAGLLGKCRKFSRHFLILNEQIKCLHTDQGIAQHYRIAIDVIAAGSEKPCYIVEL